MKHLKFGDSVRRLCLLGCVFPAAACALLFAGGWSENFRLLRMNDCYMPMPFFITVYLSGFFFASLAFFSCNVITAYRCREDAQNAKISCLTAAFLTVIWFFLEFGALSPLSSFIVISASLVFSLAAAYFASRVGAFSLLCSVFAAVIYFNFWFMNVYALFI